MSWFKRVESFLEKVDDSVNSRFNDDDEDDSYEDSYEEEEAEVEYDTHNISEEERKGALGFVSKELTNQEDDGKEDENKENNTENNDNNTNIDTNSTNANNSNTDNANNNSSKELIGKLTRENKIFRAEIIKQAKEIDKLKKDDVRLRTLELEATTNRELIDTLRSSLDEAIRDKAALEADLATEADEHKATRDSAQQREEQLESYIETYVASISAANTQLQEKESELAETKDALAALQGDNDALRQEIESLRQLNSDLTTKLNDQSELISSKEGEKEILNNENEKDDDDNNELSSKKNFSESECEALKKSLEESLKTIEELRKRVSEVTSKNDSLEHDLGRYTEAAKEKDEHIVQLTQDSDKMAQALSEARREVHRLEGEAKALTERTSKAEGTVDKLRRQLAAKSVLSAEHMQLESRVRVLTESLGAAQAQLEDIISDNQRLQILAGATPEEAAEAAKRYAREVSLPLGGTARGGGESGGAGVRVGGGGGGERNPKNVVGTLTRFVYQNFDTFDRSFAARYLLPFAAKYDSVEMKAQQIFGSSFFLRAMVYLYVMVIQIWWFVIVLRDLSEQ